MNTHHPDDHRARDDDEALVLRCHNEHAREHLAEALRCRRAGALRSALRCTWAAVVCDLSQKLAELDLLGEPEVTEALAAFRELLLSGEPSTAQARQARIGRERALLELAGERFELLSPLERDDVDRLRRDSERCSHPLLSPLEAPFRPSESLVATHLDNAIELVLARESRQGRLALKRLLSEVESPYFPSTIDAAAELLARGPMKRARASLVYALVRELTFASMTRPEPQSARARRHAALGAISRLFATPAAMALRLYLAPAIAALEEPALWRAVELFGHVPGVWRHLDEQTQRRLLRYLAQVRDDHAAAALDAGLRVPELAAEAAALVARLPARDLRALIEAGHARPCRERAVALFASATEIAGAEWLGRNLLLPIASVLEASHVRAVCEAVITNEVLYSSWVTANETLLDLLERTDARFVAAADAWDRLAVHYMRPELHDIGARLVDAIRDRQRAGLASDPGGTNADDEDADDEGSTGDDAPAEGAADPDSELIEPEPDAEGAPR